jgi:2-methylaconitate cis-trans-isomerase PrpF
MSESRGIRCAIYRGGTSRGVYFLDNDLPYPQAIRTQILLNILGSPDPRQVDGLGGGTSSTSKTMIIGPSRLQGTEVQMLFGQVSLHSSIVDWRGTCGNLTTAVGHFAIDQGLVTAVEPVTEVSIYSVNTRKRIIARVPVSRGRAMTQGDYKIPGVRGTGARIDLEYVDPAVGRLLTMQTAHRAYMGAGAICTGVAALAPGTIVSDLASVRMRETGLLRIGHPQGVMDVSVKAALQNGDLKVQSATIARTARRIMEGYAYVPQNCFVS